MELGMYSFADMEAASSENRGRAGYNRLQELLEEIRFAEEVGLDIYAVGEHHRPDYAVSAPAVVLGAAAVQTKRIRLSSAVTVLSSDDPVRVYQQYATVDLLSGGRAEIMAGRGSFIESFPLFGYDLNDYDVLFSEKLELLLKLNESERVSWSGRFRAPIRNLAVYPRALQPKIPIWIAVGGTPASVLRAGKLGLPLALAIIGGAPEQFAGLMRTYRETYKAGNFDKPFQLGINGHVFVGEDSQRAADDFYPSYASMMTRIGRERGWPPLSRAQFEQMRSPRGSLLVGSPQQVVDKILYMHELFGHTRFLAQMSVGPLEHAKLLKSIELFGTRVAPEIRKALAPATAR